MNLIHNPETRRQFIARWRKLLLSAFSGGGVVGSYGYANLWERHQLSIEKHEVRLALGERAPAQFRIVTLTDLHFDPLYEHWFLEKCVKQVNALKPDLVFLTGDLISYSSKRIDELAEILGELRPSSSVMACLGNHDFWDKPDSISKALEKVDISVLLNQHTRSLVKGGEVIVAGLQSVWGGHPDWSQASHGIKADERVLMMMHEPDYADVLCHDERIALQCAGHTHGGQVRLPGYGALILPRYGKRYQAGFYRLKGMHLHVNRGIGTVDKHVRFFCPPEIACLDITNTSLVA